MTQLHSQLLEMEAMLEKATDDEALEQEQQKLIVNFMTERLEMEFLSQVVIRLF